MRLVPGVMVGPRLIDMVDTDHDGVFSETETRAYAVALLGDLSIAINGRSAKPQLDSWTVPAPAQLLDGLGEISIHYHVDLPTHHEPMQRLILANRHVNASSVYLMNVEVPHDSNLHIIDQKRNERQSVYELDYTQSDIPNLAAGPETPLWIQSGAPQFASLFGLGMRHIADGTDHLLFLVVLLLPAPLLAEGSDWRKTSSVRRSLLHIAAIITAFTLAHSLTLILAAMHFVHVASRPVEVLIAGSILISAAHAIRPIFPGKEAWIAAFFGLIHGLAFADTLDRLGLSRWDRMAGILAFNLGIEAMQVLAVATIMPSLLIMSRTRFYSILRITGALVAGLASLAWISERLFEVQTPVDAVAAVLAKNGGLAAAALLAASLACIFLHRRIGRSRLL